MYIYLFTWYWGICKEIKGYDIDISNKNSSFITEYMILMLYFFYRNGAAQCAKAMQRKYIEDSFKAHKPPAELIIHHNVYEM